MHEPDPGAPGCALLVDLDGPLTRLFPSPQHLELARRLAARLPAGTVPEPDAGDHVLVLRAAAAAETDLVIDLERAAADAEREAARRARPAIGARAFLDAAATRGAPVAVVSNNDADAVRTALDACGLSAFVHYVAARRGAEVSRLKPAPDLLLEALDALGATTGVMHGDTVGDVHAARAAGIPAVGIVSDPDRAKALLAAGAAAVVADLGAAIGLAERHARYGRPPADRGATSPRAAALA